MKRLMELKTKERQLRCDEKYDELATLIGNSDWITFFLKKRMLVFFFCYFNMRKLMRVKLCSV